MHRVFGRACAGAERPGELMSGSLTAPHRSCQQGLRRLGAAEEMAL